ncbi:MAG: hypothetical protein M0Z60_05495 [Nitrospiraceae bacterium]|nr:hypothetical protein [Nitrospiraceae bacterium]
MDIPNEDISEVTVAVPEGHSHIRTRIVLRDGTELVFREAAMANILRAFVTVKTHPEKTSVRLAGRNLEKRKKGFAGWQLIEERPSTGSG